MQEDKLLFTVVEAAHSLNISPSALRRLIKGGQLAAINIGRSVRIPRDEIGRFLSTRYPRQ